MKLRQSVAPLMAIVAIALAALVWHNLPVNTDIYAPFPVRADSGGPAVGRAITTTVTGIRIAPRVTPDPGRAVQAIGVWVIVDATVTATRASGMPRAELLIGANTYVPTDRLLPGTTLGSQLEPGITQQGAWVFDVPSGLLDTVDSVVLRTWIGFDPRLDSILVVDIPLHDADRLDAVKLARPVIAAS